MKGANKNWNFAYAEENFKKLPPEEKARWFGNNERCVQHGNFRCYNCVRYAWATLQEPKP